MKTLITAIAIILGYQVSYAQRIIADTIKWNTSEFVDINTDVKVANEATFISQGKYSIKWVQQAGAYTTEFSVSDIEGEWSDLNLFGAIVYRISAGSAVGTIKFVRTNTQEIFVEMHIKGSTSDIDLRYKISSYSKI